VPRDTSKRRDLCVFSAATSLKETKAKGTREREREREEGMDRKREQIRAVPLQRERERERERTADRSNCKRARAATRFRCKSRQTNSIRANGAKFVSREFRRKMCAAKNAHSTAPETKANRKDGETEFATTTSVHSASMCRSAVA